MINRAGMIYFAFVLGCILATAVTSGVVERLNNTIATNVKTYNTLTNIKDAVRATIDMETGVRGYFLNKKIEYLEPFSSGKNNYKIAIDTLQNDAKNDLQLKLKIEQADKTHNEWVDNIEKTITEINKISSINDVKERTTKMNQLDEKISNDSISRKGVMDNFRQEMNIIEVEENLKLTMSLEATERYKNYTRLLTYVSPIIAVLLIFLLTRMLESCNKDKDLILLQLVDERNKKKEAPKPVIKPKRKTAPRKKPVPKKDNSSV
jgi:CHASE3 domain sensor protein